jgi:hypothetical protein
VLSLFAVLAGLFFVLGVAAFNTYVMQLEQFQALDQLQKINLSDHLVAKFYDSMGVVLLFLVPGITMGLFAAEKVNGTQELLLTSPLTVWDIVLGKFAAGAGFIAILVAMVAAFPALLFLYDRRVRVVGDAQPGGELPDLVRAAALAAPDARVLRARRAGRLGRGRRRDLLALDR